MISEMGMTAMSGGGGEGFNSENLGIYRSGSAPPTVEGSMTAMSGLFASDALRFGRLTEEEILSESAYLSSYYSNVNLNPRLPPPVMSKEDWRFAQRLQAGSSAIRGIGDRVKVGGVEEEGNRSLFSMQPGFVVKEEDGEDDYPLVLSSGEWLDKGEDGLTGLTGLPAGQQKTFADLFQNNQGEKASISSHSSRSASLSAFDTGVEHLKPDEACATIRQDVSSQNDAASTAPTLAPLLGPSLSRSGSPDPQLVAIVHRTNVPPIGVKIGNDDQKKTPSNYLDRASSGLVDPDYLVAALSGINLSSESIMKQSGLQNEGDDHHQNSTFNLQRRKNLVNKHSFLQKIDSGQETVSFANQMSNASFPEPARNSPASGYFKNPVKRPHKQVEMHRSYLPFNSYVNIPSATVNNLDGSLVQCPSSNDLPNSSFKSYGMRGYSVNALASVMGDHVVPRNAPPLFDSAVAASGFESLGTDTRVLGGGFSFGANWNPVDLQNPNKNGCQTPASALHFPHHDSGYIQYLSAVQASTNSIEPSLGRGSMSNSYAELLELKKAYLRASFQPQKMSGLQFLGRSGYHGNPSCSLGMSYPGSPVASSVLPASPVGPSSPLRPGGLSMHFPFTMTNFPGNAMGSWHLDNSCHVNDDHASSLLEEFKNNKIKCFELSDIAGHVVEFSADQYGSRFIQQKLETASAIEKDMFFDEVLPQAFSLMTDVFGNYVVQKFFEHGSAAQRRELADQLTGNILTLSLQMYGCRVIQKAIEVVDLDQQTKMVLELDGHVMHCVRDQNGNHVIQKCIECIPQDAIQFIVSTFYDQVITLSTHPYGCRVIQRILEYCDDPKTQQIMMDEILQCICILAQDQYGNYVVQHVLEHGKPHERSAIIEKLTGQIVYMSQQKFASNVVEKCLIFAGPQERQLLVNEMLGTTEENEPLQAMMKDQFANYVVQKVLETCDDRQRELILSRIKLHLNSLKKYTYGKHIVARVEKLVAAGERRVGVSVM